MQAKFELMDGWKGKKGKCSERRQDFLEVEILEKNMQKIYQWFMMVGWLVGRSADLSVSHNFPKKGIAQIGALDLKSHLFVLSLSLL